MTALTASTRKARLVIPFTLSLLAVFGIGVRHAAAGQVKDSRLRLERFAALLTHGEGRPEALWDAIRDVPLIFGSESGEATDIACEVLLDLKRAGDPHGLHAGVVVDQPDGHLVVAVLRDGRPVAVWLDQESFVLHPAGRWLVRDAGRWAFPFDADHLTSFGIDAEAEIARTGGRVRIDLSSVLHYYMEEKTPSVRWDHVSRTVVLEKGNGTIVEFRFRTPTDAVVYRTALAEAKFRGRDGSVISVRGFRVKALSPERLPHNPLEHLMERINAAPFDSNYDANLGKDLTSLHGDGKAEVASFAMLGELDRMSIGSRPNPNAVDEARRLVARWGTGMLRLESDESFDSLGSTAGERIGVMADSLSDSLQAAVDQVPAEQGWFPDDPAMIGRETEAVLGSPLLRSAVTVALKLSVQNELPPASLVRLLDAVGDIGCPASFEDGRRWRPDPPQPVLEAILWSRWGWPCETRHADAASSLLAASGPHRSAEAVAVETLLRLDATKRISPMPLDRWYASDIAGATPVRRRRSLALVTAQPSGRAWLLTRLAVEGNREVREAVAFALRGRAEATLKTGMFDFMSEEECRRVWEATKPAAEKPEGEGGGTGSP